MALNSACSLIERKRISGLPVFRDGHRLHDCAEFLNLPRQYLELPLCIIVGEREEFHRRLHAHQFCRVLNRALDVGVREGCSGQVRVSA